MKIGDKVSWLNVRGKNVISVTCGYGTIYELVKIDDVPHAKIKTSKGGRVQKPITCLRSSEEKSELSEFVELIVAANREKNIEALDD